MANQDYEHAKKSESPKNKACLSVANLGAGGEADAAVHRTYVGPSCRFYWWEH